MSGVLQAAQSGDRRKMLVALRDAVANQIDSCESGRDMASLSKRLVEITDELAAMPNEEAQKTPFEIAREKAKKKSG